MAIDTEARTRPKMRLYYAIMLGGFTISLGALILLNFTAFAIIAVASTIIVVIAAARLNVAGSQIVVDDEVAMTPLAWARTSWKRILISLAVFSGFGAVIATGAVFDRRLPAPWPDLLMFTYINLMVGCLIGSLLREFRRSWATRSEHRPIPLAIRLSILVVGTVVAAGSFYFLAIQSGRFDFTDMPLGLPIVIALLSFGVGGACALSHRRDH